MLLSFSFSGSIFEGLEDSFTSNGACGRSGEAGGSDEVDIGAGISKFEIIFSMVSLQNSMAY